MLPYSKGRKADEDRLAQNSTSNQQASASKDPWMQFRKVLFQKAKVRTTTGVRRMPTINAYLEKLVLAAAQGDLSAQREQTWLIGFLDKKNVLLNAEPKSEGCLDMERRIQEHTKVVHLFLTIRSLAFLCLRGDYEKQYRAKYGPLSGFYEIIPDYVEPERCIPYLERARRALRRAGPSSEVGYRKPPVATRWKQKQSGNPSGKRKPQNDAWEPFRAALLRAVPVIQEGRKTSATSVAVACTRLFEQAFKGNAQARRLVRTLLIELDRRGLLVPPEPIVRRRKPRTVVDGPTEARFARVVLMIMGPLQRDMHEAYGKIYGPVDNLETDFEQTWRVRTEELASRYLLTSAAA